MSVGAHVAQDIRQLRFDEQRFTLHPMNESVQARLKVVKDQLDAPWSDGRARPWNPPFDFIPLVVNKIERDRACGVFICSHWPAQTWYARSASMANRILLLDDPVTTLVKGENVNPAWRPALVSIG